MNVVHLCSHYYPHVGGVEKHVQKLNEELIRRGHTVTVVTQKYDSNLKKQEHIDQVSVLRLSIDTTSKNRYKLSLWKSILRDFKLLKSADVIHIHDVFFWILPFIPLLSRKTFITFHGYEGNALPTRMQVFWHKLANLLTRGSICIGGFHERWYKVRCNYQLFGAVEQNIAKPKIQNKRKKIIFIGRLEEDNGIVAYLQALKMLKDQKKSIHLDIYGGGSQRGECEKFVRLHHLDVSFHGFVPNVAAHISRYDCAFVSRYLSILEALATDTPAVAQYTNELTKDYLSISPFAKSIAICQTPEQIAKSVENPPLITQGTKLWLKEQTWQRIADVYEHLWYEKS